MKLENPDKKFIHEILSKYKDDEGDGINKSLRKLFITMDNIEDKNEITINVAALNKIYSTAIVNINPVVNEIYKKCPKNLSNFSEIEFVEIVDKIATVSWENNGVRFKRKNLSFASKYVHFLSDFKTPIYDSYIWIIIKGYFGQSGKRRFSFTKPHSYQEFYNEFRLFKKEMRLEAMSNYNIDKFLWMYGKILVTEIKNENDNRTLDQSKSELQKRLKQFNLYH